MSSPTTFGSNPLFKFSTLTFPIVLSGVLAAFIVNASFSVTNAAKMEPAQINIASFHISSPAFAYGGKIPERYTCDGINVLPPIHIENIPAKTKTLALTVDDPDSPTGSWTHLALWNMPAKPLHIEEAKLPKIATVASNDFGNIGYGGPCPPRVNKLTSHRYYFKAYALDSIIDLPRASKRKDLDKMLAGHIITKTEYMGTYERIGASQHPNESAKNTSTKK